MTEQEKETLIRDLCARLPYETKARKDGMETNINLTTLDSFYYGDEIILPYLRPMSSMTEEEYKEWRTLNDLITIDGVLVIDATQIDWLNAHHFDYRGMIEKGLALPAKDGMYSPPIWAFVPTGGGGDNK